MATVWSLDNSRLAGFLAGLLHRGDGGGVGLFTHSHVPRLLPDPLDVGHDLGVRPLDVDRNADHDPRGQAREPEHFGAIALWIEKVAADGAQVGDHLVDPVALFLEAAV